MRNDCRHELDLEQNRYCQVAAAVVGSAVVGAVGSSMAAGAQADAAQSASDAQSRSAQTAADAQVKSTQAQIAESRRQFDSIQQLLAPYTNSGPGALFMQQNLAGLNGPAAQAGIISGIQNGNEMANLTKQGENAILQNASATGGLRGGNTQAALAQFRPALLSSLIDKQYSRLGGLVTLGQNSAAGVGSAGQNASGQIISALQQQGAAQAQSALTQGAAQAGNALAQGRAQAGLYSGLSQAAGAAFGGGGMFNGFGNSTPTSTVSLPEGYSPYGNTFGGESFGGGGFANMGFTGYGA